MYIYIYIYPGQHIYGILFKSNYFRPVAGYLANSVSGLTLIVTLVRSKIALTILENQNSVYIIF